MVAYRSAFAVEQRQRMLLHAGLPQSGHLKKKAKMEMSYLALQCIHSPLVPAESYANLDRLLVP
jgi:hypothetical protein